MTYKQFHKIQLAILIALASYILTSKFQLILKTRNLLDSPFKVVSSLSLQLQSAKTEQNAKMTGTKVTQSSSEDGLVGQWDEYIKEKQSQSLSSQSWLTDRFILPLKRLIRSGFDLWQLLIDSVKVSYLTSQNHWQRQRQFFLKTLEGTLDSRALPLAQGLLFGDISGVSQETYHSFKVIGILHVVSASSANFTLFLHFGLLCLRPLLPFCGRRQLFYVHFCLVLFYFSLVGPAPSTSRAFISLSLGFYFSLYCQRSNSSLHNLLLTGIITLYISPLYLKSLGFQLSFLASLGIIIFAKPLEKYLNSKQNYIVSSLILTFSAQFLLLPVLVFHFGEINYIAFLANLLILPLVELLTIGFLVLYIVFFLNKLLSLAFLMRFLSLMINQALDILFFIISWLEKIPHKSFLFSKNIDLYTGIFILLAGLGVWSISAIKSLDYNKKQYRILS